MINPFLTVPCPHEIQESVHSVEDISLKYYAGHKLFSLEDIDLSMGKSHTCDGSFHLFEENEINMEKFTSLCLEDELLILLENNEMQHSAQNDDPGAYHQEQWNSTEIYMLEHTLDHFLFKPPLEFHLQSLNVLSEIDLLFVIETSYAQRNTGFCSKIQDIQSPPLVEPNSFEESKMLDLDLFDISEAFSLSQTALETESCDKWLQNDMHFKSFDDLIVCHELAMADDTFKSLPVSIINDAEKIWSQHTVIADMLAGLELLPVSASDEIYLDWHLLTNDKCDCSHLTSDQVLSDIEPYNVDSDLQSSDDSILLLDYVLSGDALDSLNNKENRVNMLSGGSCVVIEHLSGVALSNRLNDDHQTIENDVRQTGTDLKMISSSDDYVSQFNDLEFFLNPRRATGGRGFGLRCKEPDVMALLPSCLSLENTGASSSTVGPHLDVKLHKVNLSANILILIDSFQTRYQKILEDNPVSEDKNLLSLPEDKLMECMVTESEQTSFEGHGENNSVVFIALCAIKRMAWCLCFYGIHALYFFVDKLFPSLECWNSRLSFLQSLIEDAFRIADKEITKSHPSLVHIQTILQQNSIQKRKVLIVADQDLWWPLKMLLDLMNFSVKVAENSSVNGNQLDARTVASLKSDCLLVSHEHVSASIQLNKFDIILEYGGPNSSSKLSTIYPKSHGSLPLHFLKMELNGVAKALCEGVGTALNSRFTMKLEQLLDFTAIAEKCKLSSMESASKISSSMLAGSEPNQPSESSFPRTVVIVNTQNFQKEMIISRRSTYQRVLAMEKSGAQVVERDLSLPVDLIISASMCLAWYDSRSIGKSATSQDGVSSSIALCVDNIAANALTSLSFSFSSCILVFEGESDFLATMLDSSDELYAAAASLGIDIQIFCSYSSELTDEIILNCIRNGSKFGEGLFPKLPESETLAESFLTKFPSINPLSAHAILSSTSQLAEFLEWSQEGRIRALQKYQVPVEAVRLLSVLCRYGELDESKSGMTDCSSSVSSAPNSENLDEKFNSERQKRKFNSNVSSPTISYKRKLADLSLDDELFGQEQTGEGRNLANDLRPSSLPMNGRLFGHKQKSLMTTDMKRWDDSSTFGDLHEDLMGEVIDVNDKFLSGQDLPIFIKKFSPFMHEMEENPRANDSRTARRLSFGKSNIHPDFPLIVEANTEDIDCRDIMSLEADSMANFTRNFHKQLNKEGDTCRYGATLLSKAVQSSELRQGSPWTLEFLNRVREKSRCHKKSLARGAPASRLGYSGNVSRIMNRKSPSILEYYKYQGGTTPAKRQNRHIQPSTSLKKATASAPLLTSWTPPDKRASRTLSFATRGSGNQTKLVWSDTKL
ncbi:hypothetical protein Nepgr_031410 [Nepenthes gracilis]|uniref:Protein SHORTAGE IN CHIASMATA 1 n=1 Tax=Nepenthes gracilis TaxID=150966 RepID=A0AAD3TIS6_NEPGR|nr:hypothetical protein Nepgr_031410 [Nepenthes gracilis]